MKEWIPIKTRPMTEEEKVSFEREWGVKPDEMYNVVKYYPTINSFADDRPKGKWKFDGWGTYCSECGADMRKEQKNER